MTKRKFVSLIILIALSLPFAYGGCGGGGGGGDSDPAPSVQILPSVYDFGIVTLPNTPVPLEAKIQNNGQANLMVSEIVLTDTNNFDLNLGGGSNPCSSTSPTIGAGDNCTVEVTFIPQSTASFVATLQVKSNDSSNPTVNLQLSGSAGEITSLNVRINQVESDGLCPAATVTAYVSVIDQGGYTITGLLENDFTVLENIGLNPKDITALTFVSQDTVPLSVALVMDYSGSITFVPETQSDMENAAALFVDHLGTDDEAAIIKFSGQVKVVQGFTSDKILLKNAIYGPAGVDGWTRLYDAAWQGVDDTALRLNQRKAVIVITDGEDTDENGDQLSSNSLSDVINHANDKGIPIFTVGLGEFNEAVLKQMAEDTGGLFFDSTGSDNLKNIYSQIAKVLFEDQYILTYDSDIGAGVTGDLTIEARLLTIMGDDTKEITPCP